MRSTSIIVSCNPLWGERNPSIKILRPSVKENRLREKPIAIVEHMPIKSEISTSIPRKESRVTIQ